ncbi:hypothetical protein [Longimicrobium sp.]|uniref:hypothetical protein n=1 Tax=Longimicrobium sp. TaxID=2029185 RepID=UPI002E35A82B|nr:hypothetical protein [Longimicrobium sp.]HEX6038343.1 hypothetical protein [Longimicrobium sp.]
MMIRRRAALALLCTAVAGCDSATDVEVAARYALDVDPPVVIRNENVRIELLQDNLWLQEDGRARREVTERLDYLVPGPRDTTLTYTEHYVYDVKGSTIEMGAVCPPNALCTPPPHVWGRVTDDGLELHLAFDPDVLLTYRRLVP